MEPNADSSRAPFPPPAARWGRLAWWGRVARVGRAGLVVLVVVAYLPVFTAKFVSDDRRLIVENRAVHHLDLPVVARYFTDPSSQSSVQWQGIYRPLRTLAFAIDWAIAGDSPLWYHLMSLVTFLVGVLLVHALARELVSDGAAWVAAALFALHPVQTESVAFVSSRGDLLLLVFFVAALLAHVKGRKKTAVALFVLALFSKESAVVFPGAALLIDYLRRSRPRWGLLGVYGALSAGFAALWYAVARTPELDGFTQVNGWLGGSHLAAIVTAIKGFLYEGRLLLLPVHLVFDYYVPARRAVDAGAVIAIVLTGAIVAWALLAGRRSRFAAGWFFVAILPVSGILFPMAIPTAERFLLLPAVGLAIAVAPGLSRRTLTAAVLLCFAALTFGRALDWRSPDRLWAATARVAATPLSLARQAHYARVRAEEHHDPAAAREALAAADALFRLYREDIQLSARPEPEIAVPRILGGEVELDRARALLVLRRNPEALAAAEDAYRLGGDPHAHLVASLALERMGRLREAANAQARAIREGVRDRPRYVRLAGLFRRAAAEAEAAGDRSGAVELYRAAWRALPIPEENADARAALRRLTGTDPAPRAR